QRGDICPMAMHCGFPYIDILRYGGSLPGQPKGIAEFCCSDADTIMVFSAEIVND
ncbi:MAG: TIGR04076 family protein, partial [Firmicutes bacterium]|nr:TIGR04076 family protein [Bacillota bacterium]